MNEQQAWYQGWPVIKGSPLSGHHGHAGRPPWHGGSLPAWASGGAKAEARGVAEYEKGNPGVISATSGEFNFKKSLTRHLGLGVDPQYIGLDRYTGRRNLEEATKRAGKAFESLAAEVGARKAAGKEAPFLGELAKDVATAFNIAIGT